MSQLSTRGQLQVDSAGRMLLTIYSPIGTTLGRLYTDGNDVVFLNDFEGTAWRGKAADFGLFAGPVPLLLVGLPPSGVDSIAYGPAGIESVRLADARITYDPPLYPPKRVSIDRGQRHIEIQHLDSFVDPESITPLQIPQNYRCCVLPQL